MLKRLFFLLLLTLGLFILMGLLVTGGAEVPPPKPPVLLALPPVPDSVSDQVILLPELATSHAGVSQFKPPVCPVADANGIPVCASAYHLANYLPFCFSDRAG